MVEGSPQDGSDFGITEKAQEEQCRTCGFNNNGIEQDGFEYMEEIDSRGVDEG
jgi:hypothetical protein